MEHIKKSTMKESKVIVTAQDLTDLRSGKTVTKKYNENVEIQVVYTDDGLKITMHDPSKPSTNFTFSEQ